MRQTYLTEEQRESIDQLVEESARAQGRTRIVVTLNLPSGSDELALLEAQPNKAQYITGLLGRDARGELTEREQLESLRLQAIMWQDEQATKIQAALGSSKAA